MIMKSKTAQSKATRSIVTVGEGRGFVIEWQAQLPPRSARHRVSRRTEASARTITHRLILTAAHCLPFFPPCHPASYTCEHTYRTLLGPLGEKPQVWAACLFADPISDIAVLGSPDEEVLYEEAGAYE